MKMWRPFAKQFIRSLRAYLSCVFEHFESIISNGGDYTNFCASVFGIAFCVWVLRFHRILSQITFKWFISFRLNILIIALIQWFLRRLFQLLKLSKHAIQFPLSNYCFCWWIVDIESCCCLGFNGKLPP